MSDIGGIQQQRPGLALWRGEVRASSEIEHAMRRRIGGNFHIAAVAAARSAGRRDASGEIRRRVGPDRDRAAVARGGRAGVQHRRLVDRGRLSRCEVACAVEVAADPDGAAARRAGGVHQRRDEADRIRPCHGDRAAPPLGAARRELGLTQGEVVAGDRDRPSSRPA